MAHHLMGSYQRSLLAVLLAQFTRKRFAGGMAGVVRLAMRSVVAQVCAGCFCMCRDYLSMAEGLYSDPTKLELHTIAHYHSCWHMDPVLSAMTMGRC